MVSLDEIRAEPVVWFAGDLKPGFHQRFLQTCMDTGSAPKVVQEVTTTLECVQFVAKGVGLSFVARSKLDLKTFVPLMRRAFAIPANPAPPPCWPS